MTGTSTHLAVPERLPRWFEDVAVLLTAGTGSAPLPRKRRQRKWMDMRLAAFDLALHAGNGAGIAAINIMDGHPPDGANQAEDGGGLPGLVPESVTSVLSPGTEAYVMDRDSDAFPVKAHGLHAPAVLRVAYATGSEVITAGVAIGMPRGWRNHEDLDKDGVIYHHGGTITPKQCRKTMRAMVTVGMDGVRDGGGHWDYYEVVATSRPKPNGKVREARCAAAVLVFLDEASKKMYEPVLIPVGTA